MGTGLLPGLAWPGAAILSSGGKLGDLSGIDVEPELRRVQGSPVQWSVRRLPGQCCPASVCLGYF